MIQMSMIIGSMHGGTQGQLPKSTVASKYKQTQARLVDK